VSRRYAEADVLSALHPTPAVCGHPRDAALRAIRNSESFDRGGAVHVGIKLTHAP
jgi:isochorismate synthase EntC